MGNSIKSVSLDEEDDGSVGQLEINSTLSGDAGAALPGTVPSRAYSLPPNLRAVLDSPVQLQSNVRVVTPSPSSVSAVPTSVTWLSSELDARSSSDSDDESHVSSNEGCSTASGCGHSQLQKSSYFGAQHPQHTQHAGKLQFGIVPQQQQHTEAIQVSDITTLNEEPSMADFLAGCHLSHGMSCVEAQEETVCTLVQPAADTSCEDLSQAEAAATVALTAQHIRERYPHLFGQSSSTAALPAHAELDCAQAMQCPSDVASTAGPAGKATAEVTSQEQSLSVLSDRVSTFQGTQDGESFGMCLEDVDAAASAAEQTSQALDSEKSLAVGCKGGNVRAGPVANKQGLQAAALHASPMRQLLQDSDAAVARRSEAGAYALPFVCAV